MKRKPLIDKNITLQDALDLAIAIEDEAQERYDELASQMEVHHTADAAEFFRMMIGNEKRHGDELRERRKALFGESPSHVQALPFPDVEAPEYDSVRAFMSARQALDVALKAEVKAYDFFDQVLGTVKDKTVRKLFTELRAEEVEHQKMVKAQLDRLPPEEQGSPEDYVDEPVSQ